MVAAKGFARSALYAGCAQIYSCSNFVILVLAYKFTDPGSSSVVTKRLRDCFADASLPWLIRFAHRYTFVYLSPAGRTPVSVSKKYIAWLRDSLGINAYASTVTILVRSHFQNLLVVGPRVLIFRD